MGEDMLFSEQAFQSLKQSKIMSDALNKMAETLLSNTEAHFDEMMSAGMNPITDVADIDRLSVWHNELIDGDLCASQVYRWDNLSGGTTKPTSGLERLSYSRLVPRWRQLLSEGGMINSPIGLLPEASILTTFGVMSALIVPIFVKGDFWGFVLFEDRKNERFFDDRSVDMMRSAGFMCANAIIRMQTERELARVLRVNQSIIESMPGGMVIFDGPLNPQDCNNYFANMLKADKRQILTRFMADFTPEYQPNGELSMEAAEDLMRRAIEGETIHQQWLHQASDGEPVPVDLTLTRVKNEDNFIGLGFSYDMRELNKLMQKLEEAVKTATAASEAKGVFLSNMSHEMRTPLNTIMGMASIGKDAHDLEGKNYALDKIEKASSHLLGVINDVLDMSKIEAGKLELVLNEMSFENTLKKAINAVSLQMQQQRQEFYVTVDGGIPHILVCDDQRLTQVIINLLSNAVKFTPEGGCIRLNAYLTHETDGLCDITVEVTDTGIGITEEQQAQLFLAFSQAESGMSRKYGGSGLGLTISKRIVEMMDGKIGVTSQPREGSCFRFNFKARRGNSTAPLLDPSINWENIKVIAVDDSPEILVYLSQILKRYGVPCDTALSGADALNLISKNDGYDIYFVDWKMPGMDGVELTRQIKSRNPDKKSVVIMISTSEWNLIREHADHVGVDKFLMKPLFASDIMDCMNTCMSAGGLTTEREHKNIKVGELKGCRILLAEDVKINREILLGRMKYTGAEIDCVENGLQAVLTLAQNPDLYEMVFMDVQMPQMDGLEATRQIRQSGSTIPIIAMTANVFKEDVDSCLASGMDDHIGKPLDLNNVLNKVRKYRKKPTKIYEKGADAKMQTQKSFEQFLPYVSVNDGLKIAGEKDLYVMLLRLFKEENLVEELVGSIQSGQLTGIEQAAHKAKGTAVNLGFTQLYDMAAAIETNAKKGQIPDNLPAVLEVIDKTVTAIDAICQLLENS